MCGGIGVICQMCKEAEATEFLNEFGYRIKGGQGRCRDCYERAIRCNEDSRVFKGSGGCRDLSGSWTEFAGRSGRYDPPQRNDVYG